MAPRLLFLLTAALLLHGISAQEYRDGQYPSSKRLFGVTYSPFSSDPSNMCLTASQVRSDMAVISRIADHIRIYSLSNCPNTVKTVFEQAKAKGIRVITGIFLSSDTSFNEGEMKRVQPIVREYGDIIDAFLVGNEALFSKSLTVDQLVSYIREVKDIITDTDFLIPVGTGEIWPVYESNIGQTLVDACDFVAMNQQPFWEGWEVRCPSGSSSCTPAAEYVHLKAEGLERFYGKPVWIVESGWPTEGEKCCQGRANARDGLLASPGVENTETFINGLVLRGRAVGRPTYVHAMFDEEWKRIYAPCGTCEGLSTLLEDPTCNSCELEYHWGIYTYNRVKKQGLKLPSPP